MFWKGVLWNALIRDHLPVLRTHQMPTAGRAAFAVYHRDRGVPFLVEGLSVDVPQTLLDKYPDTKLAKLAMGSQAEEDEPIAIDIEWNHFRFVIDYMRHDKVVVPYKSSVTKESLLKALLSLEFGDEDSIMSSGGGIQMTNEPDLSEEVKKSKISTRDAIKWLNTLEDKQNARILAVQKEKQETIQDGKILDYKESCFRLALSLFQEYRKLGSLTILVYLVPNCGAAMAELHHKIEELMVVKEIPLQHKRRPFHHLPDNFKMIHQESLALFGLKYRDISIDRNRDILVKLEILSDA